MRRVSLCGENDGEGSGTMGRAGELTDTVGEKWTGQESDGEGGVPKAAKGKCVLYGKGSPAAPYLPPNCPPPPAWTAS